jgi:hypothetical protein
LSKFTQVICVLIFFCVFSACDKVEDNTSAQTEIAPSAPVSESPSQTEKSPVSAPTPSIQTTTSPIGKFDFKNYTYPLPRGWQGTMNEITLQNGTAPLSMEEDNRKIGASFVNISFGDLTGDGQDEAIVTIKIETGGAALPQVVYIFDWKNEEPEKLWYFRTGDRADGGLRDLRVENGELIVELYGQDRFIFGDVETMKIVGDEEQLCCPNYFTRNRYKLINGRFTLQGKRQTFSIAEPNSPPIENMGEIKAETKKKK